MEKNKKPNNKGFVNKGFTPKVTGIGRVFFLADNPKETNE